MKTEINHRFDLGSGVVLRISLTKQKRGIRFVENKIDAIIEELKKLELEVKKEEEKRKKKEEKRKKKEFARLVLAHRPHRVGWHDI